MNSQVCCFLDTFDNGAFIQSNCLKNKFKTILSIDEVEKQCSKCKLEQKQINKDIKVLKEYVKVKRSKI